MFSVVRFIIFAILSTVLNPLHCCYRLTTVEWIFRYYVMFSCLYEAWVYFYYERKNKNVVRSRYSLFFYFLYFYIFLVLSFDGWVDLYISLYRSICYYMFYWRP